jgi:hypothetical protein
MRSAMPRVLAVSILALVPRLGAGQGVVIDHKKVDCIVVGRHARMNACFQPGSSQVGKRRVYFRPEGVDKWFYVEMKSNAPCHEGILPKAKKQLLGKHVYYYVASEGTASAQTQEYDPVVVRSAQECKEQVVAPSLPNAPVVVFPSVPAGFVASAGVSPLVVGAVSVAAAGGGVAFAVTRDDDEPAPPGATTPQAPTPPPPQTPTTPPSPTTPPPPPPTRNPLQLACTATPRAGEAPLRVAFQAFPSGGSGTYGYLWRFGDGETSTQVTPGHTYTAAGVFTASVEVTSGTDIALCERSIVVSPPPPPPTPTGPFTLSVGLAGSGSGSVSSAPGGIACAPDCTEAYAAGTVVTLTATATGGSTFGGWTGAAGCGAGATCTVTMSANQGVTATFNPPATFPLNVNLAGAGTGTVGSAPPGIACPGDCSETYTAGTAVTLTATATGTSTFGGWTGAAGCGAATTCVVTMNAAQNVTATFNPPATFPLNVTLAGTGTGNVISNPPGITCPGDCSETYAAGTPVAVTATPTGGSTFSGWTGAAGCGAATTCVVTMNAAQNLTATFTAPIPTPTLTVALTGTGTGSVTSNPTGINCPGDCSQPFTSGTPVTLTARPNAGSSFSGWSGAPGCGAATTCLVTVTANQTVTAQFDLITFRLTFTASAAGPPAPASGSVRISPPAPPRTCAAPPTTTCVETYAPGTVVTVDATGSPALVDWGGACAGTTGSVCSLTMTQDLTATAFFRQFGLTERPPDGGPALRWTSALLARGGVGQVYLNGGSAGTVRQAGAEMQGKPRGDNHVEAVLTEATGPGTWRFEFPEGPGLEPGSLTPLLGEVIQVTGRAIVFRVAGRPGERLAFRFRVK